MKLEEIAFTQARRFEPEILWFEDSSEDLPKRIRSEIPSIRLVLGWAGSAIPRTDIWRRMDLVLSCAQESVEELQKAGYPTVQLHHGFDPRINGRLTDRPKKMDLSFIGQLMREEGFHRYRVQLLETIASKIDIEIFSPSADFDWKDDGMAILKAGCYEVARMMKSVGLPASTIKALPILRKTAQYPSIPPPIPRRCLHPICVSSKRRGWDPASSRTGRETCITCSSRTRRLSFTNRPRNWWIRRSGFSTTIGSVRKEHRRV